MMILLFIVAVVAWLIGLVLLFVALAESDGTAFVVAIFALAAACWASWGFFDMHNQTIAAIGRGEKQVVPALTDGKGQVVKWQVVPAEKQPKPQ